MGINIKKLEQEIFGKGIKLVVLFGSQVSGMTRSDSDYDIAVLTDKKNSISEMKNYNKILFFLSESLGIPDYKVDLTDLNNASPFLLQEISRNSRLIYGDKDHFAAFRSEAMREYIATGDLRDLEEKLINKRRKILAQKIYA